ncbi:hypothetical protein [Pseudoalteromonas sp. A25]|uniref:hypothetical protein n=1 Tax=Pseudoalteromonas sp. A25 TaxID=116092 RepID=UPI0012613776|nr:hypothetical protein [Pseudoalteromonas sp. A25]
MNKLGIIVSVVSIYLCFNDFMSRGFIGNSSSSIEQKSNTSEPVAPWGMVKEDQLDELTDLFNAYKEQHENEAGPKTIQLSEEVSGSYTKVISDNYQLELKAVISDKLSYALINQVELETGKSRLVKVKAKEIITGLKMEIISQTKVKLTNDKRAITLMMYQPNKKESV